MLVNKVFSPTRAAHNTNLGKVVRAIDLVPEVSLSPSGAFSEKREAIELGEKRPLSSQTKGKELQFTDTAKLHSCVQIKLVLSDQEKELFLV